MHEEIESSVPSSSMTGSRFQDTPSIAKQKPKYGHVKHSYVNLRFFFKAND